MMKTFKHSRKTANGGFTLLELMITLAVMAILLAWGFPSLNESIKNNRMTAQNNEMIAILQFARSEAIRRNTSVDVRMESVDGIWNVYIEDPDHTSDVDGCDFGQLRCADLENSTVTASATTIRFNNRGYIREAGETFAGENLVIQHDNCAGPNQKRRIDILATGQINSCKLGCGVSECS